MIALAGGRRVSPPAVFTISAHAGGVAVQREPVDRAGGRAQWKSHLANARRGEGAIRPTRSQWRRRRDVAASHGHAVTVTARSFRGDGIGPEITAETVQGAGATGLEFDWDEQIAGMSGGGELPARRFPDTTLESIRKNRLALKGPLTTPVANRLPLGQRRAPARVRALCQRPACPKTIVPGGRFENVDIVLVRENLEGLYVGVEHFVQVGDDPRAVGESIAIVTRAGCERIVRYAFEYALKRTAARRSPSSTRRTSSRW